MIHNIETVDLKKFAAGLRDMADEMEAGNLIAFAAVGCDPEGGSILSCYVDQNVVLPDLLDEMTYEIKQALFASLED